MSTISNPSFGDLAKEASLQPQEKLLEIKKNGDSLSIGIPKETIFQEQILRTLLIAMLGQKLYTIKKRHISLIS